MRDETIIRGRRPGSEKRAKSSEVDWPARNDWNQGQAGVPTNPRKTTKKARIASGSVMFDGLSCGCAGSHTSPGRPAETTGSISCAGMTCEATAAGETVACGSRCGPKKT